MSAANERIVITGTGVCSPFGLGAAALLEGMLAGETKVAALEDERDSLRPGYGAIVELANKVMRQLPNSRSLRPGTMTRYTWLSTFALGDAMRNAEVPFDAESAPRRGMFAASYTNTDRFDKYVRFAHHVISPGDGDGAVIDDSQVPAAIKKFTGFEFLKLMNNMPTAHGGIHGACQGPVNTYLGTAAGGLQAIGRAAVAIQQDLADTMYGGGTGSSVHPHLMMVRATRGLNSSTGATPADAARPWDQGATGIVPGEGAGILVLERESTAEARGAKALAVLAGWGDWFQPPAAERELPPSNEGAVAAMRRAMKMAGVEPADVDLVCSGGESCADIDALEATALAEVLGPHSSEVPVLAVTAHVGGLEAAVGPVLAALAIEVMKTGKVPPSLNRSAPIPEFAGPALSTAAEKDVWVALINVSTREGINAALVLKRVVL